MSYQLEQSPVIEEAPLMPKGSRYAGQPINVRARCSIAIRHLAEDRPLITESDAHVTVDRFFHVGEYWTAVVPLNAVECVTGQMFNFSQARTRRTANGVEVLKRKDGLPKRKMPFLNHVQSRFRLRKDQQVALYPLGTLEFGEPVHRVRDIVCSFEAVGPNNVRFNVRDAIAGHLVSAHRFMSTEEMVFERIVVEGKLLTESAPLPLNEEQRRAVLVASLLRSHEAGMSQRYFLFRPFGTNNCTSNPFHILDRIMPYTRLQRFWTFFHRLPVHPRLYLRLRGLDADPSHRGIVHEEFADYIQHPETQARKREYVRTRKVERAARSEVERS
ncbi:MAG: hypothetical protein KDA93_24095 [Planctomycetaceae bacterium]|nr:hypothetical protein [Planctomycetaceae bacterium]